MRNNKKIVLRHIDIVYFLLVICLLYISATGYLKNYLLPSVVLQGGVVLFMCGIIIFLNMKQHRHNRIVVIWTAFSIFIFGWNSAYVERGNYKFILVYISMLLLVCCARVTYGWIDLYLKFAQKIYLFYAICTIAFYFMPSFYCNKIAPLFPETQSRLLKWYNEGCMAGLTEHYSTNGMFLAVGTIIFIVINIESNKRKKRNVIVLGILVIALLLTGKRAHALFTIATSAVLYYFHLSNEKKTRVLKILGMMLLGISIFIALISAVPALGTFVVRMSSDSINTRTAMWGWALDAFKEQPILGIGWGQFRDLTIGRIKWGAIEAHAHNTYIQLLCETGVVGFAWYILWMGYMLYGAIKLYVFLRNFPKENESERIYIGFALGFQIFFLLYCMTGNPLYDYEMFVPYYVSCAVTECYKEKFCIR